MIQGAHRSYKEETMHKIYHKVAAYTVTASLLLGSWGEHIALYIDGNEDPVTVYPVRLALLPLTDQEQLRRGIPVEDPDGLRRLLEDLLY